MADESHNLHLTVVQLDKDLSYVERPLRILDKKDKGFVRERFFEVVNVNDTNALTLKKEICNVFSRYNLLVENLRGQGYDGASNMRVAVSKKVHEVWMFFSKLSSIINFFCSSLKRNCEIKVVREDEIIDIIASGELETATGANQVLNNNIRGKAKGIHREIVSFESVFILHLMNEVLEISNILCQELQMKSQDILNAINLVSSTKKLLQKLREVGWEKFVETVIKFCKRNVYSTTERAFSAMNLVKTSLRNKMDDDFLADCMVFYIERDFSDSIDIEAIIDEFDEKSRRVKYSSNEIFN
ncbi:uncharacterized protein [Henckelia pumila]|uniref:uncharacterized protein n=1 Tax=Henckelia pumila TaxID=405737 RepID=UPI003C6E4D91